MFQDLGEKLANFGNSVKTGATNVFDDAKRGASNLSESISQKRIIDASNNEIKNAYYVIGARYYKENKDNVPAGYEAVFSRIGEMEKAIADAEQELKNLSNNRSCPRCGQNVKKEFAFCTNCGFKMEEEQKEASDAASCPNCHSEISSDAIFCRFCGAKIMNEEDKPQDTTVSENICPKCGSSYNGGEKFCTKCGEQLRKD